MRWEPDVSRGEWLRPLIDATSTPPWTMHCVVPRGFAAYARIFHPVHRSGGTGDEPVRWSTVAYHHGSVAHPLMQWDSISRGARSRPMREPEFDSPEYGRLPAQLISVVAEHLSRHTNTPGRGVAGIWEGWGDLFQQQYGHSWVAFGGPDPDPVPGLGDREYEGPRLQLPARGHVLFDAAPGEFIGDWPNRAPWAHGSHPHSPTLWWPEDRAWVLVGEIDWDSTVVAGSAALVAELLADPHLNAAPLSADADLSDAGDVINR